MTVSDRRTVLRGAGAAGALVAAGPLLAACGPVSDREGEAGTDTSGGNVTVATQDVPLGGGAITGGVVVTQPVAGTYKAFSSTCTHQSCTVASVFDNVIRCSCHGSQFSAEDGSVLQGPATAPLPARAAHVTGPEITVS